MQNASYIPVSQEEFTNNSVRLAEQAVAGEVVLFQFNGKILKLEEADPMDSIPPRPEPLTVEEAVRRGMEDFTNGRVCTLEELEEEMIREFPFLADEVQD